MEMTKQEIDRACAVAIAQSYNPPPRGTPFDVAVLYRIVYKAGYADGKGETSGLIELLQIARDGLYSLDARDLWEEEIARIDAALRAGGGSASKAIDK
jgi:hypothetical protein